MLVSPSCKHDCLYDSLESLFLGSGKGASSSFYPPQQGCQPADAVSPFKPHQPVAVDGWGRGAVEKGRLIIKGWLSEPWAGEVSSSICWFLRK